MKKKALYIYPTNRDSFVEGNNSYIRHLIEHLSREFRIISKFTRIGLFDILFKIHRCDIVYFNWVEDIPSRRFGMLQVPVLFLIIALSKLLGVKIVWFIHNNVSHDRRHLFTKKLIIAAMTRYSNLILSHSSDLRLPEENKKVFAFDHPLDVFKPAVSGNGTQFDLLIWGTVAPYKGVLEFINYLKDSSKLKDFRILIAGKFSSASYYEAVKATSPGNVEIINRKLSEQELEDLFTRTNYVLFTYNSPSVLSSAALCKSLSFGKTVIGPRIGSFKELGEKGLLYNYESFSCLESLLLSLRNRKVKAIDPAALASYAEETQWPNFARFVSTTINNN